MSSQEKIVLGSEHGETLDVRAAKQNMSVEKIAAGLWSVTNRDSDSENTVKFDSQDGWVCTGQWSMFNPGEKCKHIRRVQMEIGERDWPSKVPKQSALPLGVEGE